MNLQLALLLQRRHITKFFLCKNETMNKDTHIQFLKASFLGLIKNLTKIHKRFMHDPRHLS